MYLAHGPFTNRTKDSYDTHPMALTQSHMTHPPMTYSVNGIFKQWHITKGYFGKKYRKLCIENNEFSIVL